MAINNVTHLKPNQAQAAVNVFVNGIGVLCFNDQPPRAELGFLKVKDHPFIMEIYNSQGVQVWPLQPLPDNYLENCEINVNSTGSGTGWRYQTAGDKSGDAQDFRWLIDLDNIYQQNLNFLTGVSSLSFFAKLYVNNGVFYNEKLSKNDGILIDVNNPQNKINLGKVGKIIGAAVSPTSIGQPNVIVTLSWAAEGRSEQITLAGTGQPYYISIRHKCDPAKMQRAESSTGTTPNSDFYLFYTVIEKPANQPEYNLEYSGPEPDCKFDPQSKNYTEVESGPPQVGAEACQSVTLPGKFARIT